jgi:tight adherence protein B
VVATILALVGAYGVFLLYTALVLHWRGVAPGPARERRAPRRRRVQQWLAQAGLEEVRASEFLAVMVVLALVGGALAFTVFGGLLPAVAAAGFAACAPMAWYRARRDARRGRAREAWPGMIEGIRLHTGSLGRSIPTALFEVGRRGPAELRPGFAAAEREWLISTDFSRAVAVLKDRLADPTADAACETLLVAHEIGGGGLDRRLAALVDDRTQDLQGRKDARAKQAAVRFARRFVLIVPLGMALAGLSIGTGRAAYQTPLGQLAVVLGIAAVVGCWLWAGRLMRLPEEERVLGGETR